jgi:ABC-type Fe3+/spermidine/putrescine transport system ATPase subunit
MVFQNYALYPHLSVFENMAFGLTLRKFPKEEIKRRVDNAARIWGWSAPGSAAASAPLRRPRPAASCRSQPP